MSLLAGRQLQCSTGTWSSSVPTSFAYQWQDSADGSTGWADVSGKTRSDLLVAASEAGKFLRCKVIASSAGGASAAVYSDVVGPVVGPAVDILVGAIAI